MSRGIVIIIAFLWLSTSYSQKQKKLFKVASEKISAKQFSEAINIYNQILLKDENNDKAYLLRGNCYDTLGDKNSAFKDFSKAIEINKKSEFSYIGRGSIIYLPGGGLSFRLKDALSDINNAIELNPNNPLSYNLRGEIKQMMLSAKMIDDKEPINDFESSLKLNPENIRTLNNIANYYDSQGKFDSAISYYQKSIKLNPNQSGVYYSMACIKKYFDKDTTSALEYFNISIELDSSFCGNFIERGRIYCKRKDFINGIKDYNHAIRLDSNNYSAYYDRGNASLELKNFQQAYSDFSKIINRTLRAMAENAPSFADYFYDTSLYYRGFALYSLDRHEEACYDWIEAEKYGVTDTKQLVSIYCYYIKDKKKEGK